MFFFSQHDQQVETLLLLEPAQRDPPCPVLGSPELDPRKAHPATVTRLPPTQPDPDPE
jgi:hypothetical protein